MRGLHAFLGQRQIVKASGFLRIKPDIELIVPAEFKARLTHGVVPDLRAGDALGEVCGVRGDFVGDDAVLDVVFVRQP